MDADELAIAKSMRGILIQLRDKHQAEVDRLDKEIAELETAIQEEK